jgi:hypothetical protein
MEFVMPSCSCFEEWATPQRRKVDGGLGEIARLIGTRRIAVEQSFGLGDIAAAIVSRRCERALAGNELARATSRPSVL